MRCGGVTRARSATDSCRSGGLRGRSVIPRSIGVESSTESFNSYLTAIPETELTVWDGIVAGQPGDRPGTGCPQPAVRKSALAGGAGMVTLLIALGFFIVIAILGPLLGADSRVPGGWTPIEPGGKLWPGPR